MRGDGARSVDHGVVAVVASIGVFGRVRAVAGERGGRAGDKLEGKCDGGRENTLANDHRCTEKKVIDVVGKDGVDNADAVEVGKFSFCFTGCLEIVMLL